MPTGIKRKLKPTGYKRVNIMAEENTQVQQTPVSPTTPEPTSTQPVVKTFTQEEVDKIVRDRLAREDKKHQDTDNTVATLTNERDKAVNDLAVAQAELTAMKRASYLAGKGVTDKDEQEFLAFKLGKLVNDKATFEQVCDEYFKTNEPKLSATKVRVDMSAPLANGTKAPVNPNDAMNNLIRGIHK